MSSRNVYVRVDSSNRLKTDQYGSIRVHMPHGLEHVTRVAVKSLSLPNTLDNAYGELHRLRWIEYYKSTPSSNDQWQQKEFYGESEGHLECLKYAHEKGCPMFGDDRYYEIMQLGDDEAAPRRAAPHRDAVRSYLDSIRGPIGCPIESVMAKLDEVAPLIPEQTYIEMSRALMRAHREKKRRRPNQ